MKIKLILLTILFSRVVLADATLANSVESSVVLTPSQIKQEAKINYNSAESHDFIIDQCSRDQNGICTPTLFKDAYISPNNYIQDPFNHMLTAGGHQSITESDVANKSLWDQFLTNGRYTAQGGAAWAVLNVPNNNYGYGGSLFMQSGHVGGFAVGGTLEVMNPFLQPNMRYLSGDISYYMLPNEQVFTPSQLYLEYQLPNEVQVDAGWLILRTPWMTSYDDAMLVTSPFQGVLANYQMTDNWRLTGIATNAFEEMGSNSFNQNTMYNSNYGNFVTRSSSGQAQPFSSNYNSSGSLALGSVYHPSSSYDLNLWAYSFSGYANTLYADSNYEFHVNNTNKFNLGVQLGNQNTWGLNSTIPQQVGDGAVNSYLGGVKIGYSFDDWLNAELSYDGMFGGANNSFYGGGFISPYTFTVVTDPLYTSGLGAGMIEQGAGNSYRAALTFKPIPNDSKTKIELAYEQFNTVSPLQEYDLDIKWVPNGAPKGLILHWEADYAVAPVTDIVNGGNFFFMETIATYTY